LKHNVIDVMDQSLPQLDNDGGPSCHPFRGWIRGKDPVMGASDEMVALEQQLRSYEEELARLRVENDQLRRSSQAFGELAERLSVALQTATRVNRRATAADTGGGRRVHAES
jgi:hypothetical protein